MVIGVPRETLPGEKRVALVPAVVPSLAKAGFEVVVEAGAGEAAGFADAEYRDKGARLEGRARVFEAAELVLHVRSLREGDAALRHGQVIVGMLDPLGSPERVARLAEAGVSAFALELLPRTTRAQSMDVLSSMATIVGYKAVILAADALPSLFPMLMTAAGTLQPARVFVVGAGVAGLQAIATARRLGAVVEAYDVRPAVKEQVKSLGAGFVELPLEAADTQDAGGYAKAQDESFYRRQRETMARVVAASDVVITTAAVPGRRAPLLVTADMLAKMRRGSVIVDLAAEQGGNCEATRAGETVWHQGVAVMGPTNLAATIPHHASQMYARNLATFVLHAAKGGRVQTEADDDIVRETLACHAGEVVSARVREALGAGAAAAALNPS